MILASQTLGTVLITIIAFLIVSLLLISVLLFVKQKLSTIWSSYDYNKW